jgi:hypothetical protein
MLQTPDRPHIFKRQIVPIGPICFKRQICPIGPIAPPMLQTKVIKIEKIIIY